MFDCLDNLSAIEELAAAVFVRMHENCEIRDWAVVTSFSAAALGAAVDFVLGSVVAQPMEKKGTTPYVTHFIFRPLMSIEFPALEQLLIWRPWAPLRI
jgi:hypothetical protein